MNSPNFLAFLAYSYFEEHPDKVDVNRGAFKKTQFYNNLEKTNESDVGTCTTGLISKKNNNCLNMYAPCLRLCHNVCCQNVDSDKQT